MLNRKKHKLNYQSFPEAIQPVAHNDIPIPEFKEVPDLSIDERSDQESYDHKELTDGDDDDDEHFACPSTPVLYDPQNLNDFIKALSLFKNSSKVLA